MCKTNALHNFEYLLRFGHHGSYHALGDINKKYHASSSSCLTHTLTHTNTHTLTQSALQDILIKSNSVEQIPPDLFTDPHTLMSAPVVST